MPNETNATPAYITPDDLREQLRQYRNMSTPITSNGYYTQEITPIPQSRTIPELRHSICFDCHRAIPESDVRHTVRTYWGRIEVCPECYLESKIATGCGHKVSITTASGLSENLFGRTRAGIITIRGKCPDCIAQEHDINNLQYCIMCGGDHCNGLHSLIQIDTRTLASLFVMRRYSVNIRDFGTNKFICSDCLESYIGHFINRDSTLLVGTRTFGRIIDCDECGVPMLMSTSEYSSTLLNSRIDNILCTTCYSSARARQHSISLKITTARKLHREEAREKLSLLAMKTKTATKCGRCELPAYAEEIWDGGCPSCNAQISKQRLMPYNYKPYPVFLPSCDIDQSQTPFFGVEYEISFDTQRLMTTESMNKYVSLIMGDYCTINNIKDKELPNVYCKYDSSIGFGIEIVTHPMTLEYHQNEMKWDVLLDTLVRKYNAIATNRCGIHVHISRAFLSQSDRIKLAMFFAQNRSLFVKIAGRETERMAKFKKLSYVYNEADKKILAPNCILHSINSSNRHEAINWNNPYTIEFRIYSSTTNPNMLLSYVECTDAIARFSKYINIKDVKRGRHTRTMFRRFVLDNIKSYPHFVELHKEILCV